MNVRVKIQTRLDILETQLTAGEHLHSAQGIAADRTTYRLVNAS